MQIVPKEINGKAVMSSRKRAKYGVMSSRKGSCGCGWLTPGISSHLFLNLWLRPSASLTNATSDHPP